MVYQTEHTHHPLQSHHSVASFAISIPLIILVTVLGITMPVPTRPSRTAPEKYHVEGIEIQNSKSQKIPALHHNKKYVGDLLTKSNSGAVQGKNSIGINARHHSAVTQNLVLTFECEGYNILNGNLIGDQSIKSRWERVTAQFIESFWNEHLVEGISFVEKVELPFITIDKINVEDSIDGESSTSYFEMDESVTPMRNQMRKMKFREIFSISIIFTCHDLSYNLIDFEYKKFGVTVSDINILQDPFSTDASRQLYLDSLIFSTVQDVSQEQKLLFESIIEVSPLTKLPQDMELHENSHDKYVEEGTFYIITGILYVVVVVSALHYILKHGCKSRLLNRRMNARVSNVDGSGDISSLQTRKVADLQHMKSDPNLGSRIDIYAPPGNLGVVIEFAEVDNDEMDANQSPPMVHSVRDDSPLKAKLQKGDIILAVDGEIVSGHGIYTVLEAKKKLSRKITIWRPKEGSTVRSARSITSAPTRRIGKSTRNFKRKNSFKQPSPFENEAPAALPTAIDDLTRSVDDILSKLEHGNIGSIVTEDIDLSSNMAQIANDQKVVDSTKPA